MLPLLQRSQDVRVAECESFLTCVSFMAGLALPMLVRVSRQLTCVFLLVWSNLSPLIMHAPHTVKAAQLLDSLQTVSITS